MGTAHNAFTRKYVVAGLRDGAGRHYPLQGAAIRIGRIPDNDIVLSDDDVSRNHAVITDTGGSFVITDLRCIGIFDLHVPTNQNELTLVLLPMNMPCPVPSLVKRMPSSPATTVQPSMW